jgi:hypothetical protein
MHAEMWQENLLRKVRKIGQKRFPVSQKMTRRNATGHYFMI